MYYLETKTYSECIYFEVCKLHVLSLINFPSVYNNIITIF